LDRITKKATLVIKVSEIFLAAALSGYSTGVSFAVSAGAWRGVSSFSYSSSASYPLFIPPGELRL